MQKIGAIQVVDDIAVAALRRLEPDPGGAATDRRHVIADLQHDGVKADLLEIENERALEQFRCLARKLLLVLPARNHHRYRRARIDRGLQHLEIGPEQLVFAIGMGGRHPVQIGILLVDAVGLLVPEGEEFLRIADAIEPVAGTAVRKLSSLAAVICFVFGHQVTILLLLFGSGAPGRKTVPRRGFKTAGFSRRGMKWQFTAYSPKASAAWLLMSCSGPT